MDIFIIQTYKSIFHFNSKKKIVFYLNISLSIKVIFVIDKVN